MEAVFSSARNIPGTASSATGLSDNKMGAITIRDLVDVAVALVGFFGVWVLKSIQHSIEETRKSVDELNIKVATVIEKTAYHEKQLDDHGERIKDLEKGGR